MSLKKSRVRKRPVFFNDLQEDYEDQKKTVGCGGLGRKQKHRKIRVLIEIEGLAEGAIPDCDIFNLKKKSFFSQSSYRERR